MLIKGGAVVNCAVPAFRHTAIVTCDFCQHTDAHLPNRCGAPPMVSVSRRHTEAARRPIARNQRPREMVKFDPLQRSGPELRSQAVALKLRDDDRMLATGGPESRQWPIGCAYCCSSPTGAPPCWAAGPTPLGVHTVAHPLNSWVCIPSGGAHRRPPP